MSRTPAALFLGLSALAFLPLAATAQEAPAPITCQQTAQSVPGEEGASVLVVCPADCADGRVWGTEVYSDDSSICRAALHDGAIGAEGGVVEVTFHGGQSSYPPSLANGVQSEAWGPWTRSFLVNAPDDTPDEAVGLEDEAPEEEGGNEPP